MGSNTFGTFFSITTWGESHGKAIGVVIDGCPAGLDITEEDINCELMRRAPGRQPHTSPRKEPDSAEIYSGVFEGKTTGAPLSILIPNQNARSQDYEPVKELYRPGHANYTYLEKYGIYDYRGGGRASARETACRVAAGAVAKRLLLQEGICPAAYLCQLGRVKAEFDPERDLPTVAHAPLFCPDPIAVACMKQALALAEEEGDSLGGIVELYVPHLPAGLGEPIYHKVEALLAQAMMSLPASKGVEIGLGFAAAGRKGSEQNDLFVKEGDQVRTATNHAGGALGGITNGMPLVLRVAFKPPSSIRKPQATLTTAGEEATLDFGAGFRHDPCLAIRAVPVVEAMAALVLADLLLANRVSSLPASASQSSSTPHL